MSNLRSWLSRIEAELAKPVIYSVCQSEEIQKKLAEQQDLQRDIEQHSESVASVLTLCDVLLRDTDACGSESESDSIQETTRSLDRRWRNICTMSMERRMKIEETWRLWCKFLDDYAHFEVWLDAAEHMAANPNSADILYTSAKEELKKFEAFQRQVHERLTQLELVNKQYRRLARENRTDTASRLKLMVQDGNQRWDGLQRRVASILRRLKHFTSQREEFEGTREALLVWLTEMDLQLTNVEHFSESDVHDKMRQLNGFQQEITLNTNRIDQLIVFGENLIQKSSPLDAVLIEDELEELHSYCQEVFGRVARFHHRLINCRLPIEDEHELSDPDMDLEDSSGFAGGPWQEDRRRQDLVRQHSISRLLVSPLEHSGRETPGSVDSIPLEWDHTVDVGGSSSPEDEDEEPFYSALSDVEITENQESFVKATSKTLRSAMGKSVTDHPIWHSQEGQDRRYVPRELICGLSYFTSHCSTPYRPGYVKLMSECGDCIDNVKRMRQILSEEEDHGLVGLKSSDKQTGVIKRWEMLEAQSLSDQKCIQHNSQPWEQLTSDLHDITAWLNRVLPELERLQKLKPPIRILDMECNVRKLKEMQKIFHTYKAQMISINLVGREFLQSSCTLQPKELQELQEGLRGMNQGWAQACTCLDGWEQKLHNALLECQDFNEILRSLLLLLAHVESKRYAVNIHQRGLEYSVLLEHQSTLRGLEEDLLNQRHQVHSLEEIASQLLLEAKGEDSTEAKEKVHVIANKLRLLLRQVAQDLRVLEGRLVSCPPAAIPGNEGYGRQAMSKDILSTTKELTDGKPTGSCLGMQRVRKGESPPPRSFLRRVLRAALPLHMLFLLLLLISCLVPMSEEDYRCSLSNNFAHSFYPMLRYTNGPPPT